MLQSIQGFYLVSRTLEKNLNSVLWNPSVCMQQPCTSVWMTLLTKTRLTDLDGEMNKLQYNSKRSMDHKNKKAKSDDPYQDIWVPEYWQLLFLWNVEQHLTDCATVVELCHTSICVQTGCPSQANCCSVLHTLHSCMNSAWPPSCVSAAHCTLNVAHLQGRSKRFFRQPALFYTNEVRLIRISSRCGVIILLCTYVC